MNLYANVLDTPISGMLALVRDDGALVALPFLAAAADAERLAGKHAAGRPVSFDGARCEPVTRQLAEYFAGRRRRFELPLAPEHGLSAGRVARAHRDPLRAHGRLRRARPRARPASGVAGEPK